MLGELRFEYSRIDPPVVLLVVIFHMASPRALGPMSRGMPLTNIA